MERTPVPENGVILSDRMVAIHSNAHEILSLSLNQDMVEWCEHNLGPYRVGMAKLSMYDSTVSVSCCGQLLRHDQWLLVFLPGNSHGIAFAAYIAFENDEDALHFKMRWLTGS